MGICISSGISPAAVTGFLLNSGRIKNFRFKKAEARD